VRLRGGQGGEADAEVRAKLGELRLPVGRGAESSAVILLERIVSSGSPAKGHVATRVQRQRVEPRRERSLTAKLVELDAETGKRILSCVVGILGLAKHVTREAPHPRFVTLAERCQGPFVAVPGALHENRVAEPLVAEGRLRPKWSADSPA
jgi:hypothetical protein